MRETGLANFLTNSPSSPQPADPALTYFLGSPSPKPLRSPPSRPCPFRPNGVPLLGFLCLWPPPPGASPLIRFSPVPLPHAADIKTEHLQASGSALRSSLPSCHHPPPDSPRLLRAVLGGRDEKGGGGGQVGSYICICPPRCHQAMLKKKKPTDGWMDGWINGGRKEGPTEGTLP